MNGPSAAEADHPYRTVQAPPRSITQRFSFIAIGGAIVLAGIAVLTLGGQDTSERWWALPLLLGAAWLVRWHLRRRSRAVSLRIDDDGVLFVRDADGEHPLAWGDVTRMNVSITNSLYVAVIGIAAVIAPIRILMVEPWATVASHRFLAALLLCGGIAVVCGAEAFGRFTWLPIFLPPRRLSIWFSRAEFEALNEEAKSRAESATAKRHHDS